MNKSRIADRIVKNIMAGDPIPGGGSYPDPGYYVLERDYSAGLGSWSIRLRTGTIVNVNRNILDYSVEMYDAVDGEFYPVGTPVSGSQFKFRWNGTYQDRDLVVPFMKAARKISSAEFHHLTESAYADGTYSVAEAMRILSKIPKGSKVYLRVER